MSTFVTHAHISLKRKMGIQDDMCSEKHNLEITAVDSVSHEGGCLPVGFLKHASSHAGSSLQTAPLNLLPLIPAQHFLCTFCLLSVPCRAVSLSVTTAACCGCDRGWWERWGWTEAWAASHKIKIMSWKTLKGCTGGWLFSVVLSNNCHITDVPYIKKKQC